MAIDVEDSYRRYGPMVLRRCRRLLRHEDDAYDAAQEVFMRLLVYENRLDARGISSLLYRMSTNVCLNRLRSARRKPLDADDDLVLRIAVSADTEQRHIAHNLLDRLFGRELGSTQTIAVLHLLDGMTLQEVADVVGLSVSGVRKRLRALRHALHELDPQPSGATP